MTTEMTKEEFTKLTRGAQEALVGALNEHHIAFVVIFNNQDGIGSIASNCAHETVLDMLKTAAYQIVKDHTKTDDAFDLLMALVKGLKK